MREIRFYGADQDGDTIFIDLDKRTSHQILTTEIKNMFGLTKREPRWAAQERGIKMIIDLAATVNKYNAISEQERLKNENLRLEKELLEIKASLNKQTPNP